MSFKCSNFFFPLHYAIIFQGHGKFNDENLQLGIVMCKSYQNTMMDSKSQIDFDRLRQIHALDSLGNVLRYLNLAKKGEQIAVQIIKKCLVEWNEFNKSQS